MISGIGRHLREGRASMVDTLTYVGRRFVNLLVVLWIAGTLNFADPSD